MESGSTRAFRNPNLTGASDDFLLGLARVSLRMTASRAADRPTILSVLSLLLQQADALSMENPVMDTFSSIVAQVEASYPPSGTAGGLVD